jgi:nucleobase:cation symporter-1, NCS1 family
VGVVPSFPGFLASVSPGITVPIGFTHLYYLCFLTGSSISAVVLTLLHYIFPAHALQSFVTESPSPKEVMAIYQDRWDAQQDNFILGQDEDNKIVGTVHIKESGDDV